MSPQAPLGFTRAMRLVRERDFQRVLRQGSRARASFLVVALAPNPLGHTRLGISIGKRLERRAVGRNRLRRLVREAFRLSYAELPIGYDLIVLGTPDIQQLQLASAQQELRLLARKAERRYREKERQAREPEA